MRSPTRSRSAPAGVACALAAAALLAPVASAQAPEDQLRATLAAQMAQAPAASGLHVVDLTDGHLVFDDRGRDKLLSASVNKLYTTATALLELGPRTRVPTQLLATGRRAGSTWRGDLYLRGRGDFTFGTAAFARKSYGSHATVEGLAAELRRAGLRRVDGRVLGDASYFSDNGGTPFQLTLCQDPLFGRGCPYGVAGRFERPMPNGPRTPIGMDRGLRNDTGAALQKKPSRFAARALTRALRSAGVAVTGRAGAAVTPGGARTLATTHSPKVSRLIGLINKPSDNYAADSMLRLLGARGGSGGSRAAGARVITRVVGRRFGLAPEIHSGSGETIQDRTSPSELVRLLSGMRTRPEGPAFSRSLSLAGRDGTLARLAGTSAENRCRLKDGTRVDLDQENSTLNLTGYCRSVGGRTFAFAVMMNGMPIEFVPPDRLVSPAYALEDAIVEALAAYTG